MAYFPLFIEIEGKNCQVVGGGAVALRKTRTLLEFGAKVKVTSPSFIEGFMELGENPYLEKEVKEFEEKDLNGAFLVIAATNLPELNKKIAKLCKEKGKYCNLADNREESDFLFPACIKRDSVVVGITTGGKSPALARILHSQIEDTMEEAYGRIADEMEKLREKVKRSDLTTEQKKRVFHRLAEELLSKKRKEQAIEEEILNQIIEEEQKKCGGQDV